MQLTHLGPYELGKVIGKGGMGSVYEAVDSATQRRVAIKALSPQLAQAEGFRERFEAEIESLKTLRHEGIVRLYGYGEQDGILFYSMELVEGTSLEEELKAGRRFNWREVAQITIQLCRALKHAHDHGVVHRDIKPANVLIDANDQVKLADFGIARLFGSSQLTTAGGVLGTADYMSLEQADGRPVSDRCDQYSLGGVMYALLAGRAPFRAKSLPEMLQLQRFADAEPVRRYAPDTPEQMEEVIKQLLSKDPADRFPNTTVLARHLEAMVKALTRPPADDFLLRESEPEARPPVDDLDESLAATRIEGDDEPPPLGRTADALEESLLGRDNATRGSSSVAGSAVAESRPSQEVSQPAVAARLDERRSYTSVEEERQRQSATPGGAWRVVLPQVAGVLLLLGGVVGMAIYVSQPKSADALFAEIEKAEAAPEQSRLREVESRIDEFMQRFPDDSRAPQVEQLRADLDLLKIQRRLQQRVRQSDRKNETLLAVERAYVDATANSENDVEGTIRALESLIALFGHNEHDGQSGDTIDSSSDDSEGEAARRLDCVRLAQQDLNRLRKELDEVVRMELPQLQQRLSAARNLQRDDPDQARAMYRAIVDLYQRADWAREVVEEARAQLENEP